MTQPDLTFPPAMHGAPVTQDPTQIACMRAIQGVDAGLVPYRIAADRVGAALVFAPEVPLREAMCMLPLCGVGFQNALGALAPPEVAVHLGWRGEIRINGARCGQLRARASDDTPDQVPDWLVVGWDLPLLPPSQDTGLTPDQTALFSEGCADVDPGQLIESWARHSLNWIARWEDAGPAALHADWRGLAHGIGDETTMGDTTGTFLGIDEQFGMLLRSSDTTQLIPLETLLKDDT